MIAGVVHPLFSTSIAFLAFFFIQHLLPLQESVLQTESSAFLPRKACSGLIYLLLGDLLAFLLGSPATTGETVILM